MTFFVDGTETAAAALGSPAPYTPLAFPTPVVNPAAGSVGPPPIPYLSPSMYRFAPTAINTSALVPGGDAAANLQSLADTVLRASAEVDNYCFGSDPASKGASLAASMSVEASYIRPKTAQLRLVCSYKPVLMVLGIDIGVAPGSLSSIGSGLASMVAIEGHAIYVPYPPGFFLGRSSSAPAPVPAGMGRGGAIYVAWSYVNGYPHTMLTADVGANATTATVRSTDGAGGLWGVFPASGSFPGTQLTLYDGANTESVFVTGMTVGSSPSETILATTPFANAHTVPAAPDFLPFTGVPPDVVQAALFMTTWQIKTRGARAMSMPQMPGGRPSGQSFAQAGANEDYTAACKILRPYVVRLRSKA